MGKKLITEFIGTFFLILAVGLVNTIGQGSSLTVLAIGVILMGMIYMGRHISGAHYNPAVTLSMLVNKKIAAKEAAGYILIQIVAGFAAAGLTQYLTGQTFAPNPNIGVDSTKALVTEIIFTFGLVLVIYNVAVAKKMAGNHIYGIAIGFTVVAAALLGGPISGGAYNPAVAIGPTVINSTNGGDLNDLWIYLVGPISGALLAGAVFNVQEKDDTPPA